MEEERRHDSGDTSQKLSYIVERLAGISKDVEYTRESVTDIKNDNALMRAEIKKNAKDISTIERDLSMCKITCSASDDIKDKIKKENRAGKALVIAGVSVSISAISMIILVFKNVIGSFIKVFNQ